MKKVLIITYYWPSSGGAGVQRWLKFVKYLRDYGWEPIVYTPENPEAPAIDHSLEKEIPEGIAILKTKIWEPYSAYKKFVGRKKDDKIKSGFLSEKKTPSFTENLSVWIRGNLFIPDARKFWINPSIRYLTQYLKENPVDAMVSTGPPHSMHLIALGIKKKLNIPWLADFRDPWTNIDFYKDLRLTKRSDQKHHFLEKEVLKNADRIVVVSNGMVNDFHQIESRDYEVITNGFDTFSKYETSIQPDEKFSIAHIGSMAPTRNPEILWKALHEIILEEDVFKCDLSIKLVGQVDYSIRESLEKYELTNFTEIRPYLNHADVQSLQRSAQVLLLIINNSPNAKLVVTGKIFEYINSARPILCIGPKDGDAANILNETNTGFVADYNDLTSLKDELLKLYRKFKKGNLVAEGKNISQYSRKNLTGKLADVLNEMNP
ncbi:MAG: glycosyltransferase family 4 protein [Bacteroidales bacterium]